jgi:hypothetical protein
MLPFQFNTGFIKEVSIYYGFSGWVVGILMNVLLSNWKGFPEVPYNNRFIFAAFWISLVVGPILGIVLTAVTAQNEISPKFNRTLDAAVANGVGFAVFSAVIITFAMVTMVSIKIGGRLSGIYQYEILWFVILFLLTVMTGSVTQYLKLEFY